MHSFFIEIYIQEVSKCNAKIGFDLMIWSMSSFSEIVGKTSTNLDRGDDPGYCNSSTVKSESLQCNFHFSCLLFNEDSPEAK